MEKKMKRTILFTLMLCMLLLVGCGAKESESIRVGSLKGPTTIGLLQMMNAENNYEFTMAVTPDEITGKLMNGDLDIALIPANVAAVLQWKAKADIQILDVNTLGVLYMVSGASDITSFEDLRGRTICLTGKGTSPDLVLQYLLEKNGVMLDEVVLEYKSEVTEVAQLLTQDTQVIGVLPQPFVTACCMQNESLNIVFDLTSEWEKVSEDGSTLVTGVTVATRDFIEKKPKAVEKFLKAHAASAEYANKNLDETAVWAVEQGIIAKEPVAKKAIPDCKVTCVTGKEMKQSVTAYYQMLFEYNAALLGNPDTAPTDAAWDKLYYKAQE